jgi:hypothetical protein
MPLPPVIAFTGLAESGKSTCARHLALRRRFIKFSFADPLKDMLAVITDPRNKSAAPDILCGRTIREALQTLGTEWGRQMIGADLWIRCARRNVADLRRRGFNRLACDDVRMDNEAQFIHEIGGIVVRIIRPGLTAMDHPSEAGISPRLIHAEITAADTFTLTAALDALIAHHESQSE